MSTTSPKLAFDLDRDVNVLAVMASSLTPYLYEDELYGHLGGNMPQLTLGGLLMRLYRLSRLESELTAEQQAQVQDAHINFEAECSKWAVHYENKLRKELNARLNALGLYLDECPQNMRDCAENYPIHAEKRIMIQHLQDKAAEENVLPEALKTRRAQVDERLRRLFEQGEFITDERLKAVYPQTEFWWLYGYIEET